MHTTHTRTHMCAHTHTHTHIPHAHTPQITLGTVTNITEAVQWLGYSFLFVRMRLNPLAYGIPYNFWEVGEQNIHHSTFLLASNPGFPFRILSHSFGEKSDV